MTLAPLNVNLRCTFRPLIRFRRRQDCAWRFALAPSVARYLCCAFHRDQRRAFWLHALPQYRVRGCLGRKRFVHPFSRHLRKRGRRLGRFRGGCWDGS